MLTLLLCGIRGGTADGHPAHSLVTEVEWNSVSARFEVAMKLDAAALEDSISVGIGDRFRLETSPDADRILAEFIAAHFRIAADRMFDCGTVRWAGHELQLHTVWLYFEYVPAFI